jgi:hypothetical protein
MVVNAGVASPVVSKGDGVLINIKVVPSASKTEIAEFGIEAIRVRIAAPPVDGEANKELTRFLAKFLGVAKSSVQILKGESGKNKKVLVVGLGAVEAETKLKLGAK